MNHVENRIDSADAEFEMLLAQAEVEALALTDTSEEMMEQRISRATPPQYSSC